MACRIFVCNLPDPSKKGPEIGRIFSLAEADHPPKKSGVLPIWLCVALLAGCASTRPVEISSLKPNQTVFEPVGVVDFRSDTLADYQRIVQPGDLIVNYMRLGRAAKKREWLFALLPYGHSMLVVDPNDP